MDKNTDFVMGKRIEKTIKNLEKNNMNGYFVEDEQEALGKITELLEKGDVVSVGGSMTLFEIGAIELLRNGNYNFLDRYAPGLTPQEIKEVFRKGFLGDAYLTSTNALTVEGELYSVDGNGNRVAAMIYGPDKVIVIVGKNKIVDDVEEAIRRTKAIASPANNKRLNLANPCVKSGFCSDCTSPTRICNNYILIKRQSKADRIHVIIINKDLGY